MAANKFATMLHKNTNRITLVLAYTFLEWILIILLLLNSLFSYLIIKFVDYFGLKRPCLWCTRLDHIIEPSKYNNSYRDLVCDDHANEISRLGYCSNHRKRAESRDMCEDCLSKKLAFFPWMKQVSDEKVTENSEENFKCSCCDVMLEKKLNFPNLLVKPSCEVLDYPQRENFIAETGGFGDEDDEGVKEGEMSVDVDQVCDEQNDEIEAEVSIGTDIPDHEPFEDIQMLHLCEFIQEDPSICSSQNADNGSKNVEEETIQFTTTTAETCDQAIKNHLFASSELNEIEDDKLLHTSTCVDSIQQKKLLSFEERESGTDDSLDGSVFSDIECADGVWTVEKLKSALESEKKALNDLYTELEEERNASAVAAHQTMAMINRLQEEKAAMQMEALQYQRMMEEQSEYDQEALQLLNDLMVKREKELEIYRRRVQDYETKEKITTRRRKNDDGTRSATSASCSNADDSDGRSVDLNHEAKDEDRFDHHQEDSNQNTPADAVLYLEESLASFEEERQSILEQLKVLEEKMVSLNDEQHFEDVESVDLLFEENGNGFYEISDFTYETNRVANGHFEGVNGKHHQEKNFMAANANRLLPLFDAEIEDGILNGHANGFDSVVSQPSSSANSELESKRLVLEEEVDHVYERLQALEADREFLKHCISSLRKGDKGIYLLQEILQLLRDLRSVELRARTIGDASI